MQTSLEREHGRLLAGGDGGAARPGTIRRRRSIPTTTRRRKPSPACFGVPVDHLLLTNGLDEGILAAAAAACRDHSSGVPEAVGVAPAFDEYEICTTARRRPDGHGAARRRLRAVGRRTFARPSHRARAIVFLSNPHNPSGRADSARHAARAREGRGAGAPLRRRGVRGLLRRDADRIRRRSRRSRTWSSGARSPRPTASPDFGSAPSSALPRTLAPLRRVVPPYSVNAWAAAALPAAIEDRAYRDWYLEQAAASRDAARRGVRAARPAHLAERRQLRAGARRRRRRAWSSGLAARGVRVRDRSADAGLRAVHPHHGRDRRGHAPRDRGARGGAVRRAVIDRTTRETSIRLKLGIEGRGRYEVSTGIRFFDHMLELVTRHGAFDLTLKVDGDLDVDQHHTVEDVGIALGEAVGRALGTRRGINRAGYFVMPMDETLAVAAIDLCGRPHAVVDLRLKVATRRRPPVRAGAGLLRRLRAGRARQRPREGALRPVQPSPDRGDLQGVRARACASPARRIASWAGRCRRRKVSCDRARRLRRRQPHLGAQGADGRRRRRSTRRRRRRISTAPPAS